jgi:hypothetical protein
VTTSLGLRGQTVQGLQAFKKRNEDARRKVQMLDELPTAVDFAHYRATLKNTAIVDEIEKRFKAFKPETYDVARQIKAIEAFEVEAVKNAEATRDKVALQLQDLEKTLKNIETARPFEDLTVVCYVFVIGGIGFGAKLINWDYRTKSRLRSRRSMRRPRSSCRRAAGACRATRYATTAFVTRRQRFGRLTRAALGKIRRSLHSIVAPTTPSPMCILAL